MALRPGTTRWHCLSCRKFFTTTLVHSGIVKCPECKKNVKAQGVAASKVQPRGMLAQQNLGLDLLFDAQKPEK